MWDGFKKKKLFEESKNMTKKFTLTAVENAKKAKELVENVREMDLFDGLQKILESNIEGIVENYYDDKITSPFAMDRLWIAQTGTDAHRDQLVKDEDAMVRFGVAQRGHMTHLAQLASDPNAKVRDMVARRGDEDIVKPLMDDPHLMVRNSAHARMRELEQIKKNQDAEHTSAEDPVGMEESFEDGTVHEVYGNFSDGTSKLIGTHRNAKEAFNHMSHCSFPTEMKSRKLNDGETPEFTYEHPLGEHFEIGADVQISKDGKFAKIERMFETKEDGFAYVVALPDGSKNVLHESELRDLEERHVDTEYAIHRELSGAADDRKPISNKPVKLKRSDGTVHSEHDNEDSAMKAYKDEPNNKGMKIVRESLDGELPIVPDEFDQEVLQDQDPDAIKNECPFCDSDEPVSPEEHQAAMNYHKEQMGCCETTREKHHHSTRFLRHQDAIGTPSEDQKEPSI
jgi:hypothetical protein